MKKIIYSLILFVGIFFIGNNVSAIENGSIRCPYERGDDRATLIFNIENGESTLVNVIKKINGASTEGYNYMLGSGINVLSKDDCPESIQVGANKISLGGEYTLMKMDVTDSETPSWLESPDKVSCANIGPFSSAIPKTTSLIITIISIIAPVLLVIMGTVDFFKATMSGKEDMIKKNQKAFIDRLIAAILVFVVIVLAKLLVSFITTAMGTNAGIIECVDCFISNKCVR